MKDERLAAWQTVVNAAHAYLRSDDSWNVRLTVLPSFAPAYSWFLYVGRAVRRLWARDMDLAKFKDADERFRHPGALQPTMREDTFTITEVDTRRLLARLEPLSLSVLLVPESSGLDGTSYEIELQVGANWVTYHWWHGALSSEGAFARIFTETEADLEQLRSHASRLGAAT